MAENPRTTAARDHDDHELIDAAAADASTAVVGHSGGRLATDIGTQDDLNQDAGDPEARTRPEKQDDIANNAAYPSDKRGGRG